ncbi:MAG: hypothetical protein HY002_12375 [Candidatus Rokubacteria bacterium]|nr:hypothetical protein [Candidatus Rokubacteria bacterium]
MATAVVGLLGIAAPPAEGAEWSRAHASALPDEAFAVVEVQPDGARLRRLPHHDAEGRLDLPHLRSALSRLHQVNWLDPANAERARRHLLEHLIETSATRRCPGSPARPACRSSHAPREPGGPAFHP